MYFGEMLTLTKTIANPVRARRQLSPLGELVASPWGTVRAMRTTHPDMFDASPPQAASEYVDERQVKIGEESTDRNVENRRRSKNRKTRLGAKATEDGRGRTGNGKQL